MDEEEVTETYEEIKPFLNKIHSQHKALKKSANMRQDFTANVSHELKTPLASISGYAELIETGMAKEEDICRFAGEIHKSSLRLLSLINDIIELSELDVMNGQMSKTKVSLTDEAVNCVEILQMNAEKHNVNISLDKCEDGCVIDANQDMIQEIIYNLCDNAIRSTSRKEMFGYQYLERKTTLFFRLGITVLVYLKKSNSTYLKDFIVLTRQGQRKQVVQVLDLQ